MKRALIAIIIIALAPALLLAGDPALIVQGGKVFYSAGDTPATATEIPVSALGNIHYMPGDTPPPPDDDPPPPPSDDVTSKVERWAGEIDEPGVAVVLEQVYGFIATQIDRGTIEPTRPVLQRVLATLVVGALDETEIRAKEEGVTINRSAWNRFLNERLATVINAEIGDDGTMTKEEGVKLFRDIAAGLAASHAGAAIPDIFNDILDQLIMWLLQQLLDLLKGIF